MCLTGRPTGSRSPAGRLRVLRYELLLRYVQAGWGGRSSPARRRQRKTDSNNNGAFSTDFIAPTTRTPRVYAPAIRSRPTTVRTNRVDVFSPTTRGCPRASRRRPRRGAGRGRVHRDRRVAAPAVRARGAADALGVVMTERNCRGQETVPIRWASPATRWTRTTASGGRQRRRDERGRREVGVPGPSGQLPVDRPTQGQCANLTVPVCLAASHIAYGSIRMETVFMILGSRPRRRRCWRSPTRPRCRRSRTTGCGPGSSPTDLLTWGTGELVLDSRAPSGYPGRRLAGQTPRSAASTGPTTSTTATRPGRLPDAVHAHAAGAGPTRCICADGARQPGQQSPGRRRPHRRITNRVVDQRVNGGTWVSVGAYRSPPQRGQRADPHEATNGYVVADAARFVPPDSPD